MGGVALRIVPEALYDLWFESHFEAGAKIRPVNFGLDFSETQTDSARENWKRALLLNCWR